MVNLQIGTGIIRNISLVIFDKDGTLMDLYNYWSNMIAYRVDLAQERFKFGPEHKSEIMFAMGVDLSEKCLRPQGPVGIKKREVVMQAMVDSLTGLGFNVAEGECCEIFKEADKHSLAHLPEIVKPVEGMQKLIDYLHGSGCKIAIATTDKTERAKLAMRILGISDKIDMVVGEDMVKNYKPHPDMVKLILRELSTAEHNAVMVGDALTDVEMGINAGLLASIGVCSGITTRDKFLDKTKYVIQDISCIKLI